jgi:hypothetical protein
MLRQRANHAPIFVFEKAALRCRKYDHWRASMAEHQ